MKTQCTKESGCEHANQIFSLYSRCRPGLTSFEYDPSCCGNSWFLHVMQHGTQVSKGAKGFRKLQQMYKGIVKGKNHPKCDALYVNGAVQDFLQARGIVNHLHEAFDHGEGWFRFEFVQKDPRMESDWLKLKTGFHGFPLECLASILKHGLLESTPDRPGCRFSRGPGIYFTKLIGAAASGYSRFVATMMTSHLVSGACLRGFLCWRCLHRLGCLHVRNQLSCVIYEVCMFLPALPSSVMFSSLS